MSPEQFSDGFAGERWLPDHAFEKEHAKGRGRTVRRPRGERVPPVRGDVTRRPDRLVPQCAAELRTAREAEVYEGHVLDRFAVHDHVARLDVTVQHAVFVRDALRRGETMCDGEGVVGAQRPTLQPGCEGLAREHRHGKVEQLGVLADGEQRHQTRPAHSPEHVCLVFEPHPRARRQAGQVHGLDHGLAAVDRVDGLQRVDATGRLDHLHRPEPAAELARQHRATQTRSLSGHHEVAVLGCCHGLRGASRRRPVAAASAWIARR